MLPKQNWPISLFMFSGTLETTHDCHKMLWIPEIQINWKSCRIPEKRSSEDDENEMSQITSSWEDDVWPLLHCPNALPKPPSTGHWKKRQDIIELLQWPSMMSCLWKRCICQPHSFLSRAANSFPANPTTHFWFFLSQCQIPKQHPELIPHWLQRFYYKRYLNGVFRSKLLSGWSCSASKEGVFQSVSVELQHLCFGKFQLTSNSSFPSCSFLYYPTPQLKGPKRAFSCLLLRMTPFQVESVV